MSSSDLADNFISDLVNKFSSGSANNFTSGFVNGLIVFTKNIRKLSSLTSLCSLMVFTFTAQKMNFSIKDFFSFLRIWLHLLKKSSMENFIFCAVIMFLNVVAKLFTRDLVMMFPSDLINVFTNDLVNMLTSRFAKIFFLVDWCFVQYVCQ